MNSRPVIPSLTSCRNQPSYLPSSFPPGAIAPTAITEAGLTFSLTLAGGTLLLLAYRRLNTSTTAVRWGVTIGFIILFLVVAWLRYWLYVQTPISGLSDFFTLLTSQILAVLGAVLCLRGALALLGYPPLLGAEIIGLLTIYASIVVTFLLTLLLTQRAVNLVAATAMGLLCGLLVVLSLFRPPANQPAANSHSAPTSLAPLHTRQLLLYCLAPVVGLSVAVAGYSMYCHPRAWLGHYENDLITRREVRHPLNSGAAARRAKRTFKRNVDDGVVQRAVGLEERIF